MVDDKNNFAVISLLTKLMDIAIGGLLQGFAGCQGNNCPRFTRSIRWIIQLPIRWAKDFMVHLVTRYSLLIPNFVVS